MLDAGCCREDLALELNNHRAVGWTQHPESSIQHLSRGLTTSTSAIGYHGSTMSKKPRKKKKKVGRQPQTVPAKKITKYSPGEIAMAVLGAALLVMVAGIVITSLLN